MLCELPLEKVQVSTKDQLCPEALSDRGISLSSSTRSILSAEGNEAISLK